MSQLRQEPGSSHSLRSEFEKAFEKRFGVKFREALVPRGRFATWGFLYGMKKAAEILCDGCEKHLEHQCPNKEILSAIKEFEKGE